MVQPIRPQDATGVYLRSVGQGAPADAARQLDGRPSRAPRRADQVTLSQQAQELRRLLEVVRNQPDTREARVEALRDAIASGEYSIDARAIAQRMIEDGALL